MLNHEDKRLNQEVEKQKEKILKIKNALTYIKEQVIELQVN